MPVDDHFGRMVDGRWSLVKNLSPLSRLRHLEKLVEATPRIVPAFPS